MTIFAGRSTIYRLHQMVQRNLLKNHQARHESTKSTGPSQSQSGAQNTSSTAAQNPSIATPQQRTIPGAGWAWIDPVMRPFRAYGRMQQRSPLMTQWESALVIYYLGDLCSQAVNSNVFIEGEYEPIRGVRAMIIGSISAIPGYKWFIFLGTHFNYKSHVASLAVKVVVNQTFFTPLFNTYFFGMQTLLAGGTFKEAKQRVINTVPTSWKNSWKLWPAVTAFSFTFIPWQHRNIFAGVIAIGWQAYLSWLNRRDETRQEKQHVVAQARESLKDEDKHQEPQKPVEKKKKKKKRRKKVDGDTREETQGP